MCNSELLPSLEELKALFKNETFSGKTTFTLAPFFVSVLLKA